VIISGKRLSVGSKDHMMYFKSHLKNINADVLPRNIPNVRHIPIMVPARPLSPVASSLPYFIPSDVKHPQDEANKAKFIKMNVSEPKIV
jgi:hypothetical protein